MTLDKKTTMRENMPNGDKANGSMDNAMRNAAKQRTEIPSEMPQMKGTREEEDNENNEITAKLFGTPPSSPRRFFTPSGSYARQKLAEHRSRRAEARREIVKKDRKRVEAGMIEQAIAESLKTTTITQACTTVQNTDQPKPLSSLKDPLPHDEKDNSSSSFPQEVASPAGSEDSDEGAWLDELPHEELINNGIISVI